MRHGNAFQLNVETQGRLTDPEQFADVVIRTDADGRQVRGVATSPGSSSAPQDYGTNTYLVGQADGDPRRVPAARLERARRRRAVKAEMKALSKNFPPGLEYRDRSTTRPNSSRSRSTR